MSDKSKDDFRTIGQAIRDLLNSYHINSKFDEMSVVSSWERLVGKPISKRTKKVFLKNKRLYVEFDSPSMKQDFMLHKADIIKIFQKEFGSDAIEEIVVI